MHIGLYKILFHFEALYCTIIFFANTPFIVQYIARYYYLLQPLPSFEVFLRCFEVFFWFFKGRISDGSRCLKYVSFLDTEKGHYCTLLCNSPLPALLYCLQYCAICCPHYPIYCNKILTISCKGQATHPL